MVLPALHCVQGGANTMQTLVTLKSTKELLMMYVQWRAMLGIYSSGKKDKKHKNDPMETTEGYESGKVPRKKRKPIQHSGKKHEKNTTRELKDYAKTRTGEQSFCINAGKMWSISPLEIRETKTLNTAKRLIKAYSKKMPI